MTQGTHKNFMFKENPHIKEESLFSSLNQYSHMLECKGVKGQQSGDEQSSSPQNSNNNQSHRFNKISNSKLLGNGPRQYNLNSINSTDHNQNFSNLSGGNSNGISSTSNSNGFQYNGNKKRFYQNSSTTILAKNILDASDDPESSNHKNNSKTTAINSRSSISHFDDQLLDSLKDNTSCSLNLLPAKPFNGIPNSFQNIRNNIGNSSINGTKGLLFENSFNNFSSSLFLNNNNNNTNNNNVHDLNTNNHQQAGKILQTLQLNQPDFSSPTYTQGSFSHFNSAKNSNTKNNNSFQGNNTQKWSGLNNSKLNLSSNLLQQQPSLSINNQEDDDDDLFNKESLSLLWAKPSDLMAQTQKHLMTSEQNFIIDGNLKQQLNKKLLGESSYHRKIANHHDLSSIVETEITAQNIHLHPHALRFSAPNNFQDDDDKGERSSRGLRNLSLKVKQIVVQRVETSYKEVADQLVEELRSQTQGQMKLEDIDEQNIKRRVYDALNVLIASKVIEKKGKVVKSCDKSRLNGRCLQVDNWRNVKFVESERDKKKEILAEKQKTLTEYAAKYMALMHLMERNQKVEQDRQNVQYSQQSVDFLNNQDQVQELSQRMNTIKEQISLKDKILIDTHDATNNQTQTQQQHQHISNAPNHAFKFPLILITVPTPQNDSSKVIIKMSRDQKNGKFFSQSKMIVNADLDVLLQMKMHQVDQQFASKYLDQEFISKYFVNNQFFLPQQEESSEESENNQKQPIEIEDNNADNVEAQRFDQPIASFKKKTSSKPSEDSKNDENTNSSINQAKKAKAASQSKSHAAPAPKGKTNQTGKGNKKQSKNDHFDNQIELD